MYHPEPGNSGWEDSVEIAKVKVKEV